MKTSALEYVNRKGERYTLQQGATATGKPKYFTGRKLTGKPLDAMPEGYEFHERPDTGQVLVRKIKPSPITPFERELVASLIRRHAGLDYAIVEVEGNRLVVHTPMNTTNDADRLVEELAGPWIGESQRREFRDHWLRRSQCHPMLRFTLADPENRIFRVERWCFRGRIDNWISLSDHGSGTLAELVERYAPHLESESFFDLM